MMCQPQCATLKRLNNQKVYMVEVHTAEKLNKPDHQSFTSNFREHDHISEYSSYCFL